MASFTSKQVAGNTVRISRKRREDDKDRVEVHSRVERAKENAREENERLTDAEETISIPEMSRGWDGGKEGEVAADEV